MIFKTTSMEKLNKIDYLIEYCNEQQKLLLEARNSDVISELGFQEQVKMYQGIKDNLNTEKKKIVGEMLNKYL